MSKQQGLSNVVKQWPTPKIPSGGGQVQRNTPGGGIRKLEDAISADVGYNTGQLNADWVSLLMGFPAAWTDIDCDDPEPWPGWPAGMGAKVWRTPDAWMGSRGTNTVEGYQNCVDTNESSVKLNDQAKFEQTGQYPYEPPRVITGQKNRAKRLKCLGNSVVPAQVAPIFEAIMLAEVLS